MIEMCGNELKTGVCLFVLIEHVNRLRIFTTFANKNEQKNHEKEKLGNYYYYSYSL